MSAESLQDAIHDWQSDEGITDATMLTGQLEVIADELRTANLIALQAFYLAEGSGPSEAALKQIHRRLGLAS